MYNQYPPQGQYSQYPPASQNPPPGQQPPSGQQYPPSYPPAGQYGQYPSPGAYPPGPGQPPGPPGGHSPAQAYPPAGQPSQPSLAAAAAAAASSDSRSRIAEAGPQGMHSYSLEETRAFTDYLNSILAGDPDLAGKLPMNPNNGDVFRVMSEGVLLCKFMNHLRPGIIDEKKIAKNPRNPFEINANHNLALSAARQLQLVTVNIGPQDLSQGTPHLCLGILWQSVRYHLMSKVNVELHPGLARLIDEDEDVKDFVNLPPEVTLLRWVNYHLDNANHYRKVYNFTDDLKDSENYLVLLHQLDPRCDTSILQHTQDPYARADFMLQQADKLGCRAFVTPADIVNGNPKLNLAFVANLFDKHPSIEQDRDLRAKQKAAEIEEAHRRKLATEEEEMRQRWKREEDEFRRRMADEEKALRERLEQEAREHGQKIHQESSALEKQRNELEKAKKDLEEKQEQFQRQQTMMANQPPAQPPPGAYQPPPQAPYQPSFYAQPGGYPQQPSYYPPPAYSTQPSMFVPPAYGASMYPTVPPIGAYVPPPQPSFYAPPTAVVTTVFTTSTSLRQVTVQVQEGRNLKKKDFFGGADPYCVLELKHHRYTTRSCKNTLHPVWYEEFKFNNIEQNDRLIISVWDRDKIGKDEFMGQVVLCGSDIRAGETWYALRARPSTPDCVSGEMKLKFTIA